MTTIDPWTWWNENVGKKAGEIPPVTTQPEWGYYRTKNSANGWDPVQIWQDEDGWNAMRSGKLIVGDFVSDLWTHCCRYPVTQEAYQNALDGKGWPDDDEHVAKVVKAAKEAKAAKPGDNSGAVDEHTMLRDEIEDAKAAAKKYAKLTSDEDAAKAQSLRNRINELGGKAEKIRVKEKAPHLEAEREVDKKWQPLVKDAGAIGVDLRKAMEEWEDKKRAKRRAEEAAAAEALRKHEEEMEDRNLFDESPTPEAPAPAPAAPVEKQIKGNYGKAAAVSTVFEVTEVTDQDALYRYFRDYDAVKDILFNLAKSAHAKGHQDIPGVKIEERAKVR